MACDLLALDVRDEADAAGVVLVGRVVQALGGEGRPGWLTWHLVSRAAGQNRRYFTGNCGIYLRIPRCFKRLPQCGKPGAQAFGSARNQAVTAASSVARSASGPTSPRITADPSRSSRMKRRRAAFGLLVDRHQFQVALGAKAPGPATGNPARSISAAQALRRRRGSSIPRRTESSAAITMPAATASPCSQVP